MLMTVLYRPGLILYTEQCSASVQFTTSSLTSKVRVFSQAEKLLTFVFKSLSFNKLFKLKGSHIKQHSGCEENEPGSELNRELCCRSKSAKVGTEKTSG